MVELLRQLVGIHRRTEYLLPKTGPKVAEKDVVAMALRIRVSGGVVRAQGAKPSMGEVDIGLRAGKKMPSGACIQLLREAAERGPSSGWTLWPPSVDAAAEFLAPCAQS